MHHKKKLIPVLLILFLASCCCFWYYQQQQPIRLTGQLEQVTVPQYTEVAGKVTQLAVTQGQKIIAGDLLVTLDDSSQRYTLAQLEQIRIQKQAALDQLLTGAEPAAIQQARNQVQVAQAAYDNAYLQQQKLATDFERIQQLYQVGGLAQQEYDQTQQALQTAENSLKAAASQVDTARQQVVLLSGNADKNAVKAAQAAVAQVDSQIAQAQEQLQKYSIRANCSGTVISINYTAGALAASGSDLIDVANQQQTELVAYLPVKALPLVQYGQELEVQAGQESWFGVVTYLDVKAQYTPKDFQTTANRNQNSIKIKLLLPATCDLKPGQGATVLIPREN